MHLSQADRRYYDDAEFRQLVDVMVALSEQLKFSPGELREAAVYAEIKVLERAPPPLPERSL